jgi:hypothetical protein
MSIYAFVHLIPFDEYVERKLQASITEIISLSTIGVLLLLVAVLRSVQKKIFNRYQEFITQGPALKML